MSNQVRDVLVQARDLISDPKKWTQNGFARTGDGRIITDVLDHRACAWCALGAIYRVASEQSHLRDNAASALIQVVGSAIGSFNDSSPHKDVLAAFDIAICLES